MERLYEENSFLTDFDARVLSCAPGKGGYEVVLDRTAFFPEGGGQPWDTGTLGPARVLEVHDRGGQVVHLCDAPLEPGQAVRGTIDWDRRFDLMQQHSGEHIVSGLAHARWGCDNVGFHLGAELVTIDLSAELDEEQLSWLEGEANRYVWQDRPVSVSVPAPEELEQLTFRSKKAIDGPVRIVTFPGADCCACCGTHVRRAGEVGLIKVLSCQKFREGIRLEILCGQRAYRYLSRIYEQDHAVARLLSVKPQDAFAAVERQNAELTAAKLRMTELEDRLFALRAQSLAGRGDVLLLEPPMRPDGARKLADAAARAAGGLAAVFAGERDSYVYALVHAGGADISPLVKRLNSALSGRGGGRNGFAQGSVQADRSAILDFFHKEGIECSTC